MHYVHCGIQKGNYPKCQSTGKWTDKKDKAARWCKSIIPALGRLSLEDHEFKTRLNYMMSSRLARIT